MRFISKLDNRGLAHYFIPLVVIVLTGIVGAYMLVAGHANPGTQSSVWVKLGDSCPAG